MYFGWHYGKVLLSKIAHVLVDTFEKGLDYLIPDHMEAREGSRVVVPLRKSVAHGTVLLLKESSEFENLKALVEVADPIPPTLLKLAQWMSSYYLTPLSKVMRGVLPSVVRKHLPPKRQLHIRRAKGPKELSEVAEGLLREHPAQAKVLHALLKKPQGLLLSELLELTGVSRSPVETLVKKGLLLSEMIEIDRSPLDPFEYFKTEPKVLTDEQQKTLDAIVEKEGFCTHLIHGVTGSGKTEIYLQAISHVRAKGESVIMLVPEISLTTQTIERFRARFDEPIAILHHRISEGERQDAHTAMREGKTHIVIGARSAIFSPLQNLGLILVDEEHDSSYKQSELMPCYNARDVAVVRGKLEECPVLLGSATPSLESYVNAERGKYQLHVLKSRADHASMPKVKIISSNQLLSEELLEAIKQRVEKGEQTLLFLNRRGYNSFQMCQSCEEVVKCTHCDVAMTFHKGSNTLACHLCNAALIPPPRQCPNCKSDQHMKYRGAGTEQVERSLHAIFPEIRTLRMDADTTRHKGSHDRLFKQFRSGKGDVLIGTQMIAKGLHFPSVTLVGILNADASLNIPDFRASESTFQLITQVAGRAGRGALKGEVILQSRMKEHPIIQAGAAADYDAFIKAELQVRKDFAYPPFAKMAKLIFSGPDQKKVFARAEEIHAHLLKQLPSTLVLYPVIPCGYAKIKDNFRFKLLIKGPNLSPLSPLLRELKTDFLIDIDPQTTLN